MKEKDRNMSRIKDKENLEQIKGHYKCKECGIDFGYSLGDMEVHKLTEHVQKGDIYIE